MAQWTGKILQAPRKFMTQVRKALMSSECMINSWPNGASSSHNDTSLGFAFSCNLCGQSFKSLQQCRLHMTKKHHWLHPAHCLLGDVATCPICLKHFSTRTRTLEHIMYKSRGCYCSLLILGPAINAEYAHELLAQSAPVERKNVRSGYRRARAELP
eukprot:2951478-Karenia_brevis.AAC.1